MRRKSVSVSLTDDVPKKDEVCWGWVVTAAACCINLVTFGVFKCMGLLYVEFPEAFNATKEQSAWPGSLMSTFMALSGPLASVLSCYFSVRTLALFTMFAFGTSLCLCYFATTITHITLLIGVVDGIGMGINFTLLPSLISQYFDKYKMYAMSIFYCGVPIGSISASTGVYYLLEAVGLRKTFLVMGCITYLVMLPALLLTPSEKFFKPKTRVAVIDLEERGKLPERPIEVPLHTARPIKRVHIIVFKLKMVLRKLINYFSCVPYILAIISSAAFFNAFVQLNIVLVDTALAQGVLKNQTLWVLAAFNIPDFFGRILVSVLSHFNVCTNTTLFNILAFILGISMFMIDFAKGFIPFICIAFIFGLTSGQMLPLPVMLVGEYLGSHNTAAGFGLLNFFNGLVSFLRPFIIGVATKVFQDQAFVFYFYGTFLIASVVMWTIYRIVLARRNKVYVTHL